MTSVLCLDTEPATIEAIRAKGHSVAVGNLGYRTGMFEQPHPPHEFEAIICDLKKPACFDGTHWGPGANNNTQCKIVEKPTDQMILQSGSSVPRFKLIQGQQIKTLGRANFDGHAVLNAVIRGGSHVFLMYNPEWVACTRFRRHRVRCFDGAGGGSWRDGSLLGSSSLRLCA
jgi:hypothetical protein